MFDRLNPGEYLICGEWITSTPNGRSTLKLENNGELILYGENDIGSRSILWQSHTAQRVGRIAKMEGTGNFVIYGNTFDDVVWESGTAGNAGAYLTVEDNGRAVIYNTQHQEIISAP